MWMNTWNRWSLSKQVMIVDWGLSNKSSKKVHPPAVSWCHSQWGWACWLPRGDRPSRCSSRSSTSRPCQSHHPRAAKTHTKWRRIGLWFTKTWWHCTTPWHLARLMSWQWRQPSWTSSRGTPSASPPWSSSSPQSPLHHCKKEMNKTSSHTKDPIITWIQRDRRHHHHQRQQQRGRHHQERNQSWPWGTASCHCQRTWCGCTWGNNNQCHIIKIQLDSPAKGMSVLRCSSKSFIHLCVRLAWHIPETFENSPYM